MDSQGKSRGIEDKANGRWPQSANTQKTLIERESTSFANSDAWQIASQNSELTGQSRARPPGDRDTRSSGKRPGIMRVVACWAALVITIVCNGLFEVFRLGGVTSAEVSNQVFAWFTPAGYVFSIWGVIYAALIAWMIAESLRASRGEALSQTSAKLFMLSCALNVGWLVAFHFQQVGLALVILVALWVNLAVLYVRMRDDGTRSWLSLAPFSLYFAWSTVAMIANATHLATRVFAAPLLANQVSTILLTLAVLVVAYIAVRYSNDYVFPLVILWATVGVGVHLMQVDSAISTAVILLSAIGAIVIYLPMVASSKSPGRAADV